MARVVKYRAIRVPGSNEPRHVLFELVDRLKAELLSGILVTWFQARHQHLFAAITARAGNGKDDVEKQPVGREGVQNFRRVFFEELTVRRVYAQRLVKSGFKRGRSNHSAFRVLGHPLRVTRGCVMIPLDGDVDRYPDSPAVAGLDLLGEQFLLQVRVFAFGEGFGVEVKPTVVAAREAADRVHVCFH